MLPKRRILFLLPGRKNSRAFFAFMRLKGSRMGMLAQDRTCQAMGSRYTGEYPDDAVWMAAKTTEGSIYGKEVYKMLFGKFCHHHGAGRSNLRGQVAGNLQYPLLLAAVDDTCSACIAAACAVVSAAACPAGYLYTTRGVFTQHCLNRDGDLIYIWNS